MISEPVTYVFTTRPDVIPPPFVHEWSRIGGVTELKVPEFAKGLKIDPVKGRAGQYMVSFIDGGMEVFAGFYHEEHMAKLMKELPRYAELHEDRKNADA